MLRYYFILCTVFLTSGFAQAQIPGSRNLFPEIFQSNLRFAVDSSERGIYHTESDEYSRVEALGFDMHKVISNEAGDVGTLLLQGYLTHIDNLSPHPPFFDKNTDTEFVFRIFNFNYKLLPRDQLNIRIGHFEIPFGLEQVINTNGTLRDYIHGPNIGVKADWGISANGSLAMFEYEVAATRGSGNSWKNKGDPYLYSGRIGTYSSNNIAVGLSFLSGEVNPEGLVINPKKRDRVGIDLQWYINSFALLAEYSLGETGGVDTQSSLLEINTTGTNESWLTFLQWINLVTDRVNGSKSRSSVLKLGNMWDISSRWDISAQFSHDLEKDTGLLRTNVFAAQVRYRF